jgi:hypothetical protein
MTSSARHWERIYGSQRPEQVSWFRPHLNVSIALLLSAGLNPRSRVIDIGGGASTFVDDLLDRRVEHVTVLDISAAALQAVRDRLGERAARVRSRPAITQSSVGLQVTALNSAAACRWFVAIRSRSLSCSRSDSG